MILNLVVIAIVGLIAYLWSSHGLFSAMIHFACTLVAAAIAWAAWEPIVYGFMLGVREEIAWGVGLAAPFIISLLLLRLITDAIIKKNMEFDDATNFVGGLVFGAMSGVISAGMLVVSIGFMRLPPSILGYAPVDYDANGNLVRSGSLWLPVDTLVVKAFETLSAGSLATATPLAMHLPDAHVQAAASRATFGGKGRTTLKPADFEIVSRYTVSGDVLRDTFTLNAEGQQVPQQAKDLEGESYPPNSVVEGYVVKFSAGAKEKGGQFVIGPGTARLVVRGDEGASVLLPIAVVSRTSAASLDMARWRFDGREVFITSVGGASDAVFAFEFVVPPNAPAERTLYVRNVRGDLPPAAPSAFASAQARDDAIRARSDVFERLVAGAAIDPNAASAAPAPSGAPIADPIRIDSRLPGAINKQNKGGLQLDSENRVIEGQVTLERKAFGVQGLSREITVERFGETSDTVVVQVDVSIRSRVSLFGRAVDAAQGVLKPILVDSIGQAYDAVGYIYDTGEAITVRFTPGRPIQQFSELPSLSRSRPNERLILLFRPSAGVTLTKFMLGGQTIEDISLALPPGRR